MMLLRVAFQTVWLALTQIWANKVRALLTTLGIIIAVMSIVTIVAATTGLKTYVLEQFATFGAKKVWIFPRMPPEMRERYSWRQIRMNTKQVDAIGELPSIAKITPIMMMNATVQFGDRVKAAVPVQGVRPSWHDIEGRSVISGRPLAQVDEDERRMICLVNDKAVQEFALPADPTGHRILLDGRRFLIAGVVETRAVSPMFGGGEPQTEIFIPFRTGEMMRPEPRMFAVAQTVSPEQHEDAQAEIRARLRQMRKLGPDDPDTFGVEAIEQVVQEFNKVAAVITFAASGIVGISLLVGGVGIMNIMLVSVTERTREIGLRKAVGAKPSVVLLQFLVEAVVLCLVGGGVGLLIGQATVLAVRASGEAMKGAVIPGWAVALAIIFSAATGIIFGMFPAIKAARLDPIVALRHE